MIKKLNFKCQINKSKKKFKKDEIYFCMTLMFQVTFFYNIHANTRFLKKKSKKTLSKFVFTSLIKINL